MQNYQENTKDLTKYTVAIKSSGDDDTRGTGILVTDDGLILTCYHVIGNNDKKNIIYRDLNIYFPSNPDFPGLASVVERYCDPELDIAFLQLQEKKIPDKVAVANLSKEVEKGHTFISFGFRKSRDFRGLYSAGDIRGIITKKSPENKSQKVIQLFSNEIEGGMSGAPVFDNNINRVNGIISEHYLSKNDVDNNLSFAIPVETIIKRFPDLKKNNPGLSYLYRIANSYIKELNKNILEKHSKLKIQDIKSKCLKIKVGDTIVSDKDLIDYNNEDKPETDKIINQFLESEDQFLLISSTFGMGKSILVEKLANKMSESFLDKKLANNLTDDENHYFPILLNSFPYHSKVFDEFQINTLEEFIEKIRSALNDTKYKILFIIDEFDLQKEYLNSDNNSKYDIEKKKKLKEILDTITLKDKIIFTSRISNVELIHNFLNLKYKKKIETILHYIRLLPLERDDVFNIFKLFNDEIDEAESKEILGKYLDIHFNEYSNNFIYYPHLFISIFSSKYKAEIKLMSDLLPPKDKAEIKSMSDLLPPKDFSLVTISYILFFSSIILGKTEEDYKIIFGEKQDDFLPSRKEKLLLRELAALEFIEKGELLSHKIYTFLNMRETNNNIKYEAQFYQWLNENIKKSKKSIGNELLLILETYFITNGSKPSTSRYKFYDEEIRDYFIAEHYITDLIDQEVWYKLNIGLPSENTIDFLKSILILISIVKQPDSKIKPEFVHILRQYIQTFNLFNDHYDNLNNAGESKEIIIAVISRIINLIRDNCEHIVKKSSLIMILYNERKKQIIDPKELWWHILEDKKGDYKIIEKETFELIIHNILAFFIKHVLDLASVRTSEIDFPRYPSEKILLNFFRSCNTIPDKLKRFNRINLSQKNLHHINLHRADLRDIDLSQTNLQYANLSEAYLYNVNLSGADLSGANLSRAKLSGEKLHKSSLKSANLSGVDLSGADLTYCDFKDTLLIGCKIDNKIDYPQFFKDCITDNPILIKGIEKSGIQYLTEQEEVENSLKKFYSERQFYNIDTGKIQKLSKSEQRKEILRCMKFSHRSARYVG